MSGRPGPADGGIPPLAEDFHAARRQALELDPAAAGLAPTAERPRVCGALIDMGFPDGFGMMVIHGDGRVDMYTTNGSTAGILGDSPESTAAVRRWLATLDDQLEQLPITDPPGLPAAGQVVLRALLFDGQRAVITTADDVDSGRREAPASALFIAMNELFAGYAGPAATRR